MKRQLLALCLLAHSLSATELLPIPAFVTGAVVKPKGVPHVYHINQKAADASDDNPGTEAQPFMTLGKMVEVNMTEDPHYFVADDSLA